ncbi:SusC/RagA family TonB-linked outer membrane protein [Reichenbachiella ulvae]|uniref:TonB-dependent receptor n=1 Tax=Reichenbachiella ulvae TaxID=2980104 RepID=A0ABT3CSB6_9BACT|nr:TonB-dependent receptor [Reichenbachiella ulvae]MCV9386606.1 TonB-dependent receptor [Reichenbachiella ulvae]
MITRLSNYSYRLLKYYAISCLLVFGSLSALAQEAKVSGKVTDGSNGDPLPGVSVLIKGTTSGVVTNFDGEYSINVPVDATLIFSFIGYAKQEVAVAGRSSIDVGLPLDVQSLEEVVVVGYGTMERSNVTGSISTVDVEAINKVPVPNVVESLRGQVAGVRVQRTSGQPGSGVSFTIRGINSLGEGSDNIQEANQPIIVIDGVPLPGGNLNELNPDDIESINVIKDAGAGAIYGSSAANGVILITTKNGSAGKPTIKVNASAGINDINTRLNLMDGDEYVQYLFDSGQGTTINGVLDPNEIENYVNGDFTDWQDEILQTGEVYQAGVSVSGGSEKLRYYLNGDVYREKGIVQNSDYNRYSLRINTDYKAYDWLTIGTRVQLTRSDADETSNTIEDFGGSFAAFVPILDNTPLGDIYDDEGNYVKYVRDDKFQVNPFHRYNESVVDRYVNRTYVNPYIEIKIIDGLSYTLNTFAEQRNQFYGRFTSSNYGDGDPNTARIQEQTSTNYLLDNILTYKKVFGKHGINATLVYGFQKNEWEQYDAFADKMGTDLLGYHAIDVSASADQRFSWDTDEWGRVYTVGRIGYDYNDKYVVTLTMRRDGSSKYTGDNKYGYFPSYSAAWNVHNENFWGFDFMNMLKIRASYGTLGNDRIGTYRYYSRPNVNVTTEVPVDDDNDPSTPDVLRDIAGYQIGTLGNEYLKWETSKQLNIGVDLGFLNDRITATVDAYQTNTTDLLLPQLIPNTNGYDSYIANIGETRNQGIDVALSADVIDGSDLRWNIAANWATNQNEIVKLNRTGPNGEPIDDEANGWFIGQNINEIYNYEYIGVWQADEADEALVYNQVPGDAKFRDVNNDGQITPGDDRVFLGNSTPDWYGGLTNTISYKGFELSVLLEYAKGITVVNNFYGGYTGRGNQLAINYWTEDNPSTEYPRVGSSDWTGVRGDAIKTEDASYISLRNVSLSYNLPSKFLENTPIKAVSVFARGNNLKYFTKMKNAYSPETGRGQYPIVRNFRFGASLTF